MKYLSLIIGSAGLIVALASFTWSWWLNRRIIKPTFKWIRSTNDNSIKLAISVINLSSRTTIITKLFLKSGTSIVSDNGYDYVKTESQVRRVKRQNERQDNIFNYDFSAERTPVQPLIQLFPDSPKTDSKNFSEPMALYGNNSIHYTYWLSPEKLPDHLEINSSNFINHFHKKVSFKIPTISNEIDKSTNVQD